jgi:hypothetical protein
MQRAGNQQQNSRETSGEIAKLRLLFEQAQTCNSIVVPATETYAPFTNAANAAA